MTQRWYVNGDIRCFTGGHVPLAMFAILILALCLLIIPTLIVIAVKVYMHIGLWQTKLLTQCHNILCRDQSEYEPGLVH